MTMTRAEYETMAAAINESYETPGGDASISRPTWREAVRDTALSIADGLCATNDRFDPLRFLYQCKVDLTEQDIAKYSHRLYLRTQTGVGAGRKRHATVV